MRDDLIKRSDALAACDIGPCDEWSDFTKSGYNLAADDCKRNIAALTLNHTADVGKMVARIEQLERENARLDAGWTDANARALAARLEVIKAVDVIKRILNTAPYAEDHAGWPQLLDDAAATLDELGWMNWRGKNE